MATMPMSSYVANEVLNASPERLVQILYELGGKSIGLARECNLRKDISGRTRNVNKAFEVLVELQNGLDFEKGGEIASNYAGLYDYCQRRLIEANISQSDEILAELQSLFADFNEAWQAVVSKSSAERRGNANMPEVLESEEALVGSLDCVG